MSFPNSDAEPTGKKKLNNKVDLLRTAKIRIEKDQAGNKYSLRISGRDEDGRCRWCRSFFTVLRRKAEREGIFLDEDWTCDIEGRHTYAERIKRLQRDYE